MDGWNTILSFWGPAYFQRLLLLVSGSVNLNALLVFLKRSDFIRFWFLRASRIPDTDSFYLNLEQNMSQFWCCFFSKNGFDNTWEHQVVVILWQQKHGKNQASKWVSPQPTKASTSWEREYSWTATMDGSYWVWEPRVAPCWCDLDLYLEGRLVVTTCHHRATTSRIYL